MANLLFDMDLAKKRIDKLSLYELALILPALREAMTDLYLVIAHAEEAMGAIVDPPPTKAQ